MSVSASLPLAPAAPVIAIPSDQTSAPRAALHPTANSNITVPTLSESEESEIETGAPSSIPEQAHVYSYAQACTYPLFFGLDSPARLGRTASVTLKLAEEKCAIQWASKNLRTTADLLLPSGTALCLTISGLPAGTGIRQTALNSQIAGLPRVILPPCAQLLWRKLYVMKSLQKEKRKKETSYQLSVISEQKAGVVTHASGPHRNLFMVGYFGKYSRVNLG